MLPEDIIPYFEYLFSENFNPNLCSKYLGTDILTLTYIYNSTEFWKCGTVLEYLSVFAFIKTNNPLLHIIFRCSKNYFDLKLWKAAFYLAHNLNEVNSFITRSFIIHYTINMLFGNFYLYFSLKHKILDIYQCYFAVT